MGNRVTQQCNETGLFWVQSLQIQLNDDLEHIVFHTFYFTAEFQTHL